MRTKSPAQAVLGVVALAAGAAHAHFVLQIPTSLGYDDEKLLESPCGSFNPLDRSKGVADWPVLGQAVSVISTHGNVEWEVNAALIPEGGGALEWVPIVVPFRQQGVGFVCFESVPGHPDWVGRDAVVQLVQHAVDGNLHQCAAVKFVAGGPGSVPGDCENTSGVSHDPIVSPPRSPSTTTPPSPPPTTTPSDTSAPPPSTTSGTSAVSSSTKASTSTTAGHGDHGASSSAPSSTVSGAPSSTSSRSSSVPTAGAKVVAAANVLMAGAALVAAAAVWA